MNREKWNSMAETGAGEHWSIASGLGALGDDVPAPDVWPVPRVTALPSPRLARTPQDCSQGERKSFNKGVDLSSPPGKSE